MRASLLVVVAAGVVLLVSTGTRSAMGLFVLPMSHDLGLSLGTVAFAMATHQLLWGLLQPFSGALNDRHGALMVIFGGCLVSAAGLVVAATATGPVQVVLGLGVLYGAGLACVGYATLSATTARLVPAEGRSTTLGAIAAFGALGQVALSPWVAPMIEWLGWSGALLALAVLALVPLPCAFLLRTPAGTATAAPVPLRVAIAEAAANPSFALLTGGFFVCGFQIGFMLTHLPAYLADCGFAATVGAQAIGIIGLFNMVGSYGAGVLGGRFPKKWLLSGIFAFRTLVIALFVAFPATPTTAWLFAGAMGLVWLGTAPLTSGLVAQIFGLRYMGALFGLVFLSHQVGSFLGAFLGGLLRDLTADYAAMWAIMLALGAVAALLQIPINESPVSRPRAQA